MRTCFLWYSAESFVNISGPHSYMYLLVWKLMPFTLCHLFPENRLHATKMNIYFADYLDNLKWFDDMRFSILTLILPVSKVISIFATSKETDCISVQSDQALYCWLTNFKVLILISLKWYCTGPKNVRWVYSI